MVKFESQFFKKLSNLNLEKGFAIAVSGGIDSVTLLHLTSLFCQDRQISPPTVLTVNHRFRAEAEHEVQFVHEQACRAGLACEILNWCTDSIPKKSQEVARKIRYTLLSQWCVEHSVKFLFTAHTKSDQAETVLMHIDRGSGVDGLSGMKEKTILEGLTVFRPLLEFTRQEILEYATHKKLVWVEDPSNEDPKYTRTFYRNLIRESANPHIKTVRLCRTALHMQRVQHCILHYVRSSLDNCLCFSPLGFITIKLQEFRGIPEEIATRLLLLALMAIGNRKHKPRFMAFDLAFSKMWREESFAPFTLHGCKIIKNSDNDVSVVREVAEIEKVTYVKPPNDLIKWDCRFIIRVSSTDAAEKTNSDPEERLKPVVGIPHIHGIIDALYVTPLDKNYIPEHLKLAAREAVLGLPILVHRDKVLAYPYQSNNMNEINVAHAVSIEGVLVRDSVVSLISDQLCQ